jgi:hypothetical protein
MMPSSLTDQVSCQPAKNSISGGCFVTGFLLISFLFRPGDVGGHCILLLFTALPVAQRVKVVSYFLFNFHTAHFCTEFVNNQQMY